MKIRGVVIAAAVFFVLAGILIWSNHHNPAETKAKADAPPSILKLDDSTITRIELKKKDAEPIQLAKTDSEWQITAPQHFPADQATLRSIVSTLSSVNSERIVEDKAADLKNYGLDRPALQVGLTEKDNHSQNLLFGDETPTGGSVYAMLSGQPRVYTVPSYVKNTVDKNLNELRDTKVFHFGFDDPNRIEIHQGSQADFLTRSGADWWSNGKKMDASSVEQLVGKLRDLTASQLLDTGFANPIAEIAVTSNDGKRTEKVSIAKPGTNYVARRAGDPTVYQLDSSSVDDLLKDAGQMKPAASAAK